MRKHSPWYLALFVALAFAPSACDKKSPTAPSPPACTYTLSTSSLSFGAAGGSNSVTVTTAANCTWSAASNRAWMAITGGASGTGNGVVNVSVASNPDQTDRTGTLTVAGQAVAVVQGGQAPCTIDISPASASYNPPPATGSFAVSTAEHCQWSATSSASWLAVTSGGSGTGNGNVSYSVDRNRELSSRTATISVGQRTFTVTQFGEDPGPCTIDVSPTTASFSAAAAAGNVSITAPQHCQWAATSNAAWLVVTSGSTGTGSGSIAFAVERNQGTSSRTGAIDISGRTFTVTQSGETPSCQYSVSRVELTFGAAGGSNTFNVGTRSECAWTATSDSAWITITGGASGKGDGVVTVSVAPNTSNALRTGTVSVGGQAVTVWQDAQAPCAIDIAPGNASYNAAAATGSFVVTTAQQCQWSATSNAAWLVVTSGSAGTGPGTVAYSVAKNSDVNPRTGTIVVGSRTFTVTQLGEAPTCDYSVSPIQFTPCMASTTLTATVTAQPGCTWTAEPDAPWLTVTGGQTGSGSGVITFRVSDNWAPPRQGVVKVRWPTPTAGQNLHVSQGGCLYAVSTAAINILAAGGPGRFDVITFSDPISCGGPLQNTCLWTAQADVPWITITTSMPQTGDNPVSFTVAPNPGTAARTGTITVRDKTVVITQAGS